MQWAAVRTQLLFMMLRHRKWKLTSSMWLTRNTSASKRVMSVVNVIILRHHHCTFHEQRGTQPLDHFLYSVFYRHCDTPGVILLFLTEFGDVCKKNWVSSLLSLKQVIWAKEFVWQWNRFWIELGVWKSNNFVRPLNRAESSVMTQKRSLQWNWDPSIYL